MSASDSSTPAFAFNRELERVRVRAEEASVGERREFGALPGVVMLVTTGEGERNVFLDGHKCEDVWLLDKKLNIFGLWSMRKVTPWQPEMQAA